MKPKDLKSEVLKEVYKECDKLESGELDEILKLAITLTQQKMQKIMEERDREVLDDVLKIELDLMSNNPDDWDVALSRVRELKQKLTEK